MSLTVGSMILADLRVDSAWLRRLLGAYELSLPLQVRVLPENPQQQQQRAAVLTGAEVSVRAAGGATIVGFAPLRVPMRIVAQKFELPLNTPLAVTLSPSQIEALEDLRAGGDLDFEVTVVGEGREGTNSFPVQDQLRVHVPQSTWIERLRAADVLNVLLLEIPLAFADATEAGKALVAAHRHFVSGDYASCVSHCRPVFEVLGPRVYGPEWPSSVSNGRDATKEQREGAIAAALLRYTHLAHHSEERGGTADFSQSEARLILWQTAALAARVWGS